MNSWKVSTSFTSINDGNIAYLDTFRNKEPIIDLTFCDPLTKLDLIREVGRNLYGNNHYSMHLNLKEKIKSNINRYINHKIYSASTNWDKFRQIIFYQ